MIVTYVYCMRYFHNYFSIGKYMYSFFGLFFIYKYTIIDRQTTDTS